MLRLCVGCVGTAVRVVSVLLCSKSSSVLESLLVWGLLVYIGVGRGIVRYLDSVVLLRTGEQAS
jgi:hypothetical protein